MLHALPSLPSLSPTSIHLPYESSSFTRTKFAFNTHLLVTLIAFSAKLIDSTCVDLISIHDMHRDSTTAKGTWNGEGDGGDETGEIENYNNNIVITIWSCLSDSWTVIFRLRFFPSEREGNGDYNVVHTWWHGKRCVLFFNFDIFHFLVALFCYAFEFVHFRRWHVCKHGGSGRNGLINVRRPEKEHKHTRTQRHSPCTMSLHVNGIFRQEISIRRFSSVLTLRWLLARV